MLKKAAFALFGLVLAVTLMSPPKAAAQVHVGVRIGSPVVVQPAPYVVYDEPYYVAHNWNSGYHDGYYYYRGQRYHRDGRGYRHYDTRYRDGRYAREHHHYERHER
jgi:opacity protein-like surface antigen